MGCDIREPDTANPLIRMHSSAICPERLKGDPMSATHTKICFYGFGPGTVDARLTSTLESQLIDEPLCFRTLTDLLLYLKSPATAKDIIVLAPRDSDELVDFLANKRLQDRRLVLVLPDADEATLSQAHLLGPRYLCFADSVGVDLAAVLNKMVANTQGSPTRARVLG
jgi:hypothetical protein